MERKKSKKRINGIPVRIDGVRWNDPITRGVIEIISSVGEEVRRAVTRVTITSQKELKGEEGVTTATLGTTFSSRGSGGSDVVIYAGSIRYFEHYPYRLNYEGKRVTRHEFGHAVHSWQENIGCRFGERLTKWEEEEVANQIGWRLEFKK